MGSVKMNALGSVLALVCAFCALTNVTALVGKTCTDISQCDSGECCQILSDFMVVGKRQLPTIKPEKPVTFLPYTMKPKTGTCQKYSPQGTHCNSWDTRNGYCGCEQGLYCQTRLDPDYFSTLLPILVTQFPTPPPLLQQVTTGSKRALPLQYLTTCEKTN